MISDTQVGTFGWLFQSLWVSLSLSFLISSLKLSPLSLNLSYLLTSFLVLPLLCFYFSFFFCLWRFLISLFFRGRFLFLFDPKKKKRKKVLPAFASHCLSSSPSPVLSSFVSSLNKDNNVLKPLTLPPSCPLVIPLKSELAYKILERGRMRFWLQAEEISSNVTYKFFANNKELSGADVRYILVYPQIVVSSYSVLEIHGCRKSCKWKMKSGKWYIS